MGNNWTFIELRAFIWDPVKVWESTFVFLIICNLVAYEADNVRASAFICDIIYIFCENHHHTPLRKDSII